MLPDGKVRIYFSSRDDQGRSRPADREASAEDPSRDLIVHANPILPLVELGTFDDNGIMPSWIVESNGRKFLYYIG